MPARLTDKTLFGPGSPGEWLQAVLVALALAVVATWSSKYVGFGDYDWLSGLVVGVGALFVASAVLGPSRIMISFFLLFLLTGHQFRSFFIVPFGGVEWHPRELILFLLLAHFCARVLLVKADIRADLTHYFVFLYMAFFLMILALGILRQPDLQLVISEARNPLFIASYFVFVACIGSLTEFRYYVHLVSAITIALALAGIAFFFYTLLSGNIINVQNALGEFVPRLIGPLRLQSIRPNGHHFFEVGTVIIISLLFSRDVPPLKRLFLVVVLGIFLFAILITMMRTAYVALFFALAVLFVLNLPKHLQVIAAYVGLVVLLGGALAVGAQLYDYVLQFLPGLETSLKGRLVETEGAFRAFTRHPFTGAGMGSTFSGLGYVANKTLTSVSRAEFQTVHNVWMYYLFKGGMVGMLMVLIGLGGIAMRGYQTIDQLKYARDRAFLRGILAAYIGQLIASLAMPRLTYAMGGVFIAIMATAIVVMARDCPKRKGV